MKLLLSCIQQNVNRWNASGDMKVIALLVGTQLGCTKFSYPLCEWDSPAKDHYYSAKEWPKHEHLQGGRKNVRNEPLVDLKKIFSPPLRFNLGMKKNSVKTMVHDGKGFQYIPQKYQSISESKIKKGIFLGPQIKDLLKDKQFDAVLKGTEKAALEGF